MRRHGGIAQGDDLVTALSPALASGEHGDHSTDDTDADHRRTPTLTPRSITPSTPTPSTPSSSPRAAPGPGRGTPRSRSTSPASRASPTNRRPRRATRRRHAARELPQFADVTTVPALGYRSIGDAEHRVRALHQHRPDRRRQVPRPDGARVARLPGRRRRSHAGVGDVHRERRPRSTTRALTDFAGPLMQWHVHDNLCWGSTTRACPS